MNDVEKSELAWKYFKYILEEYKIRDDNNKLYDEYNNYICAYDSVEDGVGEDDYQTEVRET